MVPGSKVFLWSGNSCLSNRKPAELQTIRMIIWWHGNAIVEVGKTHARLDLLRRRSQRHPFEPGKSDAHACAVCPRLRRRLTIPKHLYLILNVSLKTIETIKSFIRYSSSRKSDVRFFTDSVSVNSRYLPRE